MIVDDAYLRCALDSDEKFLQKLHDYVVLHELENRPALIIQAKPAGQSLELDARSSRYVQLLSEGSGNVEERWWSGFVKYSAPVKRSFHGIELVSCSDEPTWASELHTDGHLIAGIWSFPGVQGENEEPHKALPYFFADIFRDFTAIVGKIPLAPSTLSFDITATLWLASHLHFGAKARFGNGVETRLPTRLPVLQWPVRRATNQGELNEVAAKMAEDLLAAYGS